MGDLEMSKRALLGGADINRKEGDAVAMLKFHGPFGLAASWSIFRDPEKKPPNLLDFGHLWSLSILFF